MVSIPFLQIGERGSIPRVGTKSWSGSRASAASGPPIKYSKESEMTASDISNQRRAEMLGMPFGTATNKLRKSIIMHLAQQLEMDKCFKCGDLIQTIEEWSIEHKKSWYRADNPKQAFFDLKNIAFSHLRCNVPEYHKPANHGTKRKYDYGCRCDQCKFIHSVHMKKRVRRRASVKG